MDLIEIKKIINDFGISMPKLAEKIGISDSSFKKKIEPEKYSGYNFSEVELLKLKSAVLELAERLSARV